MSAPSSPPDNPDLYSRPVESDATDAVSPVAPPRCGSALASHPSWVATLSRPDVVVVGLYWRKSFDLAQRTQADIEAAIGPELLLRSATDFNSMLARYDLDPADVGNAFLEFLCQKTGITHNGNHWITPETR